MSLPLKSCLDQYVVEHARPERCDLRRISIAQTNLIAFFGADRDIETLTNKDIRAYRAHRRLTVTDSTIRRELVVLRAAWGHAAEEERVDTVLQVKLPPESPARERWLTEPEAERVMEQPMSDRARLFFYVGFGTGARLSAIETLHVRRVDLKGGFIDFRDPSLKVTKKRRVKTKIAAWLLPHLERACAGKAPDDYVLGGNARNRLPSIGPEVKRILKRAGIDEKGVRCHVLRRTFTMWALMGGAKLIEVSAATGDSVARLEKNYIRVNAEHARGAVNAIPNPGEQAI